MTKITIQRLGLVLLALAPIVLTTGCAFYPPFGPGDGDGGGYYHQDEGRGNGGGDDHRRHGDD